MTSTDATDARNASDCAERLEAQADAAFSEGAGQDLVEARRLYELAGERASAQHKLAEMHRFGDGGAVNLEEARRWYEMAVSVGYTEAQYGLAAMLCDGEGGPVDTKRGGELYEAAAATGHTAARTNAAVLLYRDSKLHTDLRRARRLLRMSTDDGDGVAQYTLASMYCAGVGGKVDKQEGRRLLASASCKLRIDSDCLFQVRTMLADMLHNGHGGPKDLEGARRMYTLIADKSDPHTQCILAQMCFLGEGGRVDKAEARRLYKLASNAGDADAQHNLAVLIFQGIDGPANMQKVRRLLKRAAKQGHVAARRRLDDIKAMDAVDEFLDSSGADSSPVVDLPVETVSCDDGVPVDASIDSALRADLTEGHRLYMEAQRLATYAIRSCDYAARDTIMPLLRHNPLRHKEPRMILDTAAALDMDPNTLLPFMQVNVAHLHRDGVSVSADLAEARRLYTLASTRGDSIAQLNLSQMLYAGSGGPKDVPEAMRVGKASAERGSPDEQCHYACLLTRNGQYEDAHHWHRLAADAGCPSAQFAVAVAMHAGVGCPVDLEGAHRMYELAASNGYDDDAALGSCRSTLADDMYKLLLDDEAKGVSPSKTPKQSKRRKDRNVRPPTSTLCSVDEGAPVVPDEPAVADAVDTDPTDTTAVFAPPTMESLALDERVVSGPAESTLGGETTCIVCFTNPKTHLATPCFHQCVCAECAAKLDKCPVCRSVVRDWGCVRIA